VQHKGGGERRRLPVSSLELPTIAPTRTLFAVVEPPASPDPWRGKAQRIPLISAPAP
jgi:hypothetical protein